MGLGSGLRHFFGTRSAVSSSSFVGDRGKRRPVDSLGGTRQVSDTLRGILSSATVASGAEFADSA